MASRVREAQHGGGGDGSRALRAPAVVRDVVKQLRGFSLALAGTAAHMDQGGEPDVLLMSYAGQEIIRAYCEDLLGPDLDLLALETTLLPLVEDHRSAKVRRATETAA